MLALLAACWADPGDPSGRVTTPGRNDDASPTPVDIEVQPSVAGPVLKPSRPIAAGDWFRLVFPKRPGAYAAGWQTFQLGVREGKRERFFYSRLEDFRFFAAWPLYLATPGTTIVVAAINGESPYTVFAGQAEVAVSSPSGSTPSTTHYLRLVLPRKSHHVYPWLAMQQKLDKPLLSYVDSRPRAGDSLQLVYEPDYPIYDESPILREFEVNEALPPVAPRAPIATTERLPFTVRSSEGALLFQSVWDPFKIQLSPVLRLGSAATALSFEFDLAGGSHTITIGVDGR
jgi:hypothetical protein